MRRVTRSPRRARTLTVRSGVPAGSVTTRHRGAHSRGRTPPRSKVSVTVTRPGRARSVSRFAHDGVRTVNALRSLVPSARYPTAVKSRVRREHFHGVSAVIAYSCPCSGSTDAFTSTASATTRPRSLITARVTDGSARAISRTVPRTCTPSAISEKYACAGAGATSARPSASA